MEKVARRAGRDLRGRAWAPLAPRAFVFGQDKGPSWRGARARGDRVPRTLFGEGRGCRIAKPRPGGRAARPAGPGKCGLAVRSAGADLRGSVGSGPRLALCGWGRRGGKGSVWSPELRPAAQGLAAAGRTAPRGPRPAVSGKGKAADLRAAGRRGVQGDS